MGDTGPARPGRRAVLRAGALTLGAAATGGCAPRRSGDPGFTLGVASGDPGPDGMVLWTRLARDPLAEDGLGGMPPGPVEVRWELAADERFADVLRRGTEVTGPDTGFAVHARPVGLAPGREYWYRFRTGPELSPVGRTRTAPAPGELGALTLCATSCARYDHGYYTAYRRLAEDRPDLVVALGDYLYEEKGHRVREVAGGECRTLADYRRRYAQHHADPDLQAAHAAVPWLVVFDDHEVSDDWAGWAPAVPDRDFRARRAAAFQAFYENLPLPASCRPIGPDLPLYRRVQWGALATLHLLDTRQFRPDHPCRGRYGAPDCPDAHDPARGILGAAQEAWLSDGFRRSTARWDLLAQQVMFSQLDLTPGAGVSVNPDAWDGYAGSRDRVVDGWRAAGVRNPVVLTGDVHSAWAAEVRARFEDPAAPVVGTELVTTSISSGGDGGETRPDTAELLAENPHMRWFNDRRGYLRARLAPEALTAEFRAVDFVSRPGAPVSTRASFAVEDRRAGLNRL